MEHPEHGTVRPEIVLAIPRIAGAAVTAVSLLLLLGRFADPAFLRAVGPWATIPHPVTAMGLALAGFSLVSLALARAGRLVSWIGRAAALATLASGLLRLAGVVYGPAPGGVPPHWRGAFALLSSTASPVTAVCLAGTGIALLLLSGRSRRVARGAQWLMFAVGLLALATLLAYLYGTVPLLGATRHSRMAGITAGTLLLLAIGTLALRPEIEPAAVVFQRGLAGRSARRLLPLALLIPAVLGWLRLEGERRGFYPGDFGVSLLVVAMIALFLLALGFESAKVGRLESERLRTLDHLRESEARFRALAEAAPDAIVSASADGDIQYLNAAAERMFALTRDTAIGRPLTVLMPERFRPAHLAGIRRLRESGRSLLAGRALELMGLRGEKEFPLELTLSTWPRGDDIAVLGILRDISERKEAEAQLFQRTALLEQANRELEAFSYSVSHDLRAPLRAIDGYSRMLEEDHAAALPLEGVRLLGVIRASTGRMSQLIQDLLAFARVGKQELRQSPVDMNDLVAGVLAELRRAAPDRLAATAISVARLPPATGDPMLLRHVWENLIANALKFSSGQHPPRIEVTASEESGATTYSVRDNGVGFDMLHADKLFGVFQRLHSREEFEGTGVGLAIVERIVLRHGGRVRAESSPGAGAVFSFTLPLSGTPPS